MSAEGLFLLCKKSAYIVDNYLKRPNDEIMDINKIPGEVEWNRPTSASKQV